MAGTKSSKSHLKRTATLLFLLGLFSQIVRFWVLSPLMMMLYKSHYDLAVRLKWIDGLLDALCSSPFFIGLLAGLIGKDRKAAPKLVLWAGAGYLIIPLLFVILGVGDAPEGYYWWAMLYNAAFVLLVTGGVCALGGGVGVGVRFLTAKAVSKLKDCKAANKTNPVIHSR